MKYKKVLLANLVSHEQPSFKTRSVLRSGLGYVAQALSDKGIDYKVIDLSQGYNTAYLKKQIELFKPDLIGISLFTYRYKDSYEIINNLKNTFKDISIICGGPHISTLRDKVLEECTSIDCALTGECEESIIEFCEGKPLETIKGLLYRQNNKVLYTGERPYLIELDTLSFPKYKNFELVNYPIQNTPVNERVIPVVTSRGCPYDCIYCPVKTAIGQKFRFRSPENIILELKHWYNLGYRKFSFIDDNFTLLKDRIIKLCSLIKENNLNELTLSLPNGIRADKCDKTLLEMMFNAGFRYIGIGVESGNNEVLKMLKKHESIETIENMIKTACAIGYYVDLFFIVGSPSENEERVLESVKLSSKYPIDNAFYFNLIPYPCTELMEWVEKNGTFVYEPEYYLNKINSSMDKPVFYTSDFPLENRVRALRAARNSERKRKAGLYMAKIEKKGIPKIIAVPLSRIYSLSIVQRVFNDITFLKKIKDTLK